jgi:hypothetical protein
MTTPANKNADPPTRLRRLLLLVAGAVLVVGIVFSGWWLVGGFGAIASRSVADLVAASPEINPVDATSQLCGDPACIEGWRTDVGDFLRFESDGEAEYWATVLGDDGRRYERIVLDMRGKDLTFDQRRLAIDILFSGRDWF